MIGIYIYIHIYIIIRIYIYDNINPECLSFKPLTVDLHIRLLAGATCSFVTKKRFKPFSSPPIIALSGKGSLKMCQWKRCHQMQWLKGTSEQNHLASGGSTYPGDKTYHQGVVSEVHKEIAEANQRFNHLFREW